MHRIALLSEYLHRHGLGNGVLLADLQASDLQGVKVPQAKFIHGAGASSAARGIEDASLDFAYIHAATEYAEARRLFRTWYPKVRVGGFFGGYGYLDGVLNGDLFGIRAAVNELARDERVVVRVTLDKVQSWFIIKRATHPGTPRIAVLTAYDENQRALAEISSQNKRRYCELHGYQFVEETSGFPTDRPAVWAKIRLLQKYLTLYDWVFWTDADSLIMNMDAPLDPLCDDSADMVICHEDLGVGVYNVNAGQMLFKAGERSQQFLREVWNQTWALRDAHQEQRAIIHLLFSRDLSEHVHIVAQRTFNSYLVNYTRGDFLLHFPDMPNANRLQIMRYWSQFAAARE